MNSLPPGATRIITLKGNTFFLRRLHAGDELLLQAFFSSHSRETLRLRYGYAITQMTAARARRLVAIEESKGVAFGIFSSDPDQEQLDAVGRYSIEGKDVAEIAFVVRELKRRLGMATLLLKELASVANLQAIMTFRAEVLW